MICFFRVSTAGPPPGTNVGGCDGGGGPAGPPPGADGGGEGSSSPLPEATPPATTDLVSTSVAAATVEGKSIGDR
jgi:hypothetical protein